MATLSDLAAAIRDKLNTKVSATIGGVATPGAKLVVNPSAGYSPAAGEIVLSTINDGIPAGGTTGQVLVKTGSADYAVAWATLSGGGVIVPAYSERVLEDNPFAFWQLNEASGNALDTSTAGTATGVPTGTMTRQVATTAPGGKQMTTFGGGYFTTTTLGNFGSLMGGGVTIEFLFKGTNTADKDTVLGTVNTGTSTNILAVLNASSTGPYAANGVRFTIRDSAANTRTVACDAASLFDGNLHHVVGVLTPGVATGDKIYIDGTEVATYTAKPTTAMTGSTWVNFGFPLDLAANNNRTVHEDTAAATFGGIALYNAALSSARVTAHRNALLGTS